MHATWHGTVSHERIRGVPRALVWLLFARGVLVDNVIAGLASIQGSTKARCQHEEKNTSLGLDNVDRDLNGVSIRASQRSRTHQMESVILSAYEPCPSRRFCKNCRWEHCCGVAIMTCIPPRVNS